MAIKLINAKSFSSKLKVTVQSTGKLGFTEVTAEVLGVEVDKYVRLAIDDEDENTMYMAVVDGKDEGCFKICGSGKYYYLPTSALFRSLGLDFVNDTVMYDLTRDASADEVLGGLAYKMSKRVIKK